MKHVTLAILLLSVCVAGSAAADDLKSLAKDAQSSVLLLRLFDVTGREIGSGTGFYISSDGLLVTNHHVIEPARRIEAVPASGEPLQVRGIVAVDETNDLAVVRVEVDRSRPLPLADVGLLDPGEKVVVLGGPLGLAGTLSEGIVSAIRDASELDHAKPGAAPLLQISAAVSPGSSGSPVMTYEGEVVGVVTSQYLVGQSLNFAVPVAVLNRLLDQVGPDTPEVALQTVSGTSAPQYLRNLVISGVFFGLLFLAYRRLK